MISDPTADIAERFSNQNLSVESHAICAVVNSVFNVNCEYVRGFWFLVLFICFRVSF